MSRSCCWCVVVLLAAGQWIGPGNAVAQSLPVGSVADLAAEQRIESALDAVVEVEFYKTPLTDVVGFLKEHYSVPVILDREALDDLGLAVDTPVTISLKGVSLRSFLNILLHQLDLTYMVRDQVLKITTPEGAERELMTRVYAVSDLAIDRTLPLADSTHGGQYDALVELMQETVAPDSWDTFGGVGSHGIHAAWGLLVVSQTQEVHKQVDALLAAVRKARQATAQDHPQESDYLPIPLIQGAQAVAYRTIWQALESEVCVEFHDTPLAEVAAFLSEQHGFPVFIDLRALDDVGLGPETPVTCNVEGVSLRCALKAMFAERHLAYVVTDEVLKITTWAEADLEHQIMVYPVGDLMAGQASPAGAPRAAGSESHLADVIQDTIARDTWECVGGGGTVKVIDRWGVMVVSQTDEVLAQITPLLQAMRQAHQAAAPAAAAVADGETAVLRLYRLLSDEKIATYRSLSDQEIALIKSVIAPGTWDSTPDGGAIFPLGDQGTVIRQTPPVHAEIQALLDALSKYGDGCWPVGRDGLGAG